MYLPVSLSLPSLPPSGDQVRRSTTGRNPMPRITDINKYKASKTRKKRKITPTHREPVTDFYRVSHLTIEHDAFRALSPNAKLLYFYLCKHRNRYQRNKSYFMRSDNQLVNDTNLSRNTIRRSKNELIHNRFILAVAGKGKRTKYQILDINKFVY